MGPSHGGYVGWVPPTGGGYVGWVPPTGVMWVGGCVGWVPPTGVVSVGFLPRGGGGGGYVVPSGYSIRDPYYFPPGH